MEQTVAKKHRISRTELAVANVLVNLSLLAILLWALFRSPKDVFHVDPFVKALVEIAVFSEKRNARDATVR